MIFRGIEGWRVAAVVAVAVVASTALAGCGADSQAGGTMSPSLSASTALGPTASPTPSPTSTMARPQFPVAAEAPTREGAEAFARYLFAAYEYAYSSLDAEPLRVISEAKCEFCRKAVARVEEARSRGRTFAGGEVEVVAAVVSPGKPKTGLIVFVRYKQEAVRLLDDSGLVIDSSEDVDERCNVLVAWIDNRWQVYELSRAE